MITNDHSATGVKDRFKVFPHGMFVSALRDSYIINARLPVTLSTH